MSTARARNLDRELRIGWIWLGVDLFGMLLLLVVLGEQGQPLLLPFMLMLLGVSAGAITLSQYTLWLERRRRREFP